MRNFIIWTLSFLLGFEPALMAQGNARQNAEIKAFIEMSGLSQRPVTFREMYTKFSFYLPEAQRNELRQFVQEYGHLKIPKMDVSKIKMSGSPDEVYKLQVVSKGQSASIEILNDGKQFARLNGQILMAEDMNSTATVMTKAGVPAQVAAQEFKRVTPVGPGLLLSAQDIVKMKKTDQLAYFKNLRELLESVEDAQSVNLKIKSASKSAAFGFDNRFEVVARWLQGEEAFASEGQVCVAAGHTPVVGRDASRQNRWTCATDGRGGVPEEFRRKSDGDLCGVKQFACNAAIYGRDGGNKCVDAGEHSTKSCNEAFNAAGIKDIPDLAGDSAKEFNELKAKALSAVQNVKSICEGYSSASSDSSTGRGKKKPAKNPLDGLIRDQEQTCVRVKERLATIESWSCDQPDFKSKYEKLCKEKETPAATGGGNPAGAADGASTPPAASNPSPGPGPVAPAAPGGDIPGCDGTDPKNLKRFSLSSECKDGTEVHPPKCRDASGKVVDNTAVYECTCKGNPPKELNVCAKEDGLKPERDGKKKESWLSKHKGLVILFGAGLFGLALYNYLQRQQAKQIYKNLDPVEQKPPLPPPSPLAPPAPRQQGVQ